MKAAIIGGGDIYDYEYIAEEIQKYDIIFCADGGIRHLIKMGIVPNVLIGDFDSYSIEKIESNPLFAEVEIIKHPVIKDDTDLKLCIDSAIEYGCSHLGVFAALGGRCDHELANIFLLKYCLLKGVKAHIISEDNEIYITNSALKLKKKEGFKISLMPLSDKVGGVFSSGLYYPLENSTLTLGDIIGISNEFTDEDASVSVDSGALLVILSRDK